MTSQEKIQILTSFSLFANLPEGELENIANQTKEKTFHSQSFLIKQSEAASAVYLVYKGLIQIYILTDEGKTIPIRVKEPPYIVGEMNLFDNLATTNIQALQETEALVLPKEVCKKLILTYPDVAMNFLKVINEKLRAANIHTEYYFSQSLKQRILGIVQTLAHHFPDKEISLSQEEFAYIAGASRSKVTKALDELKREKIISLSHRKIRLL